MAVEDFMPLSVALSMPPIRGDRQGAETIVREMKQISGQIVDLLGQIGREACTGGWL